ncbi:MAG: hypothetical protein HY985_06995 [Magnetospirillum sp.]|nr:hypothetical protein [Magnetospirillum sp.]
MTRISKDTIVWAAMAGITEAQRTYAEWTRNIGYFSWAPEYLLTVSIANLLREHCGALTVWPEHSVADAARDAGAADAGIPQHMAANGRADLLLYWAKSPQPRAVIEVKRNVQSWNCIADDLARARALVLRNGKGNSFQLAMVVFSTTLVSRTDEARAIRTLTGRLARFASSADALSRTDWRCYLRAGDIAGTGEEYWAPAAVVFERRHAAMVDG